MHPQASKAIEEMQAQCDQKLAECKEVSEQYSKRIQEEQAGLVCNSVLKRDASENFMVDEVLLVLSEVILCL